MRAAAPRPLGRARLRSPSRPSLGSSRRWESWAETAAAPGQLAEEEEDEGEEKEEEGKEKKSRNEETPPNRRDVRVTLRQEERGEGGESWVILIRGECLRALEAL